MRDALLNRADVEEAAVDQGKGVAYVLPKEGGLDVEAACAAVAAAGHYEARLRR